MSSKCSSERKRHRSPTFNPKLEMIKLSEEGMLKAETSTKGLPFGLISQVVNTKKKKFLEGN